MNKQQKYIQAAMVLLVAYILIIRIGYALCYQVDLEGMEFVFLHHCQRVSLGEAYYHDPMQFPFLINFYPPFFLKWYSAYFHFLHIDPVCGVHEAYVAGRVLSLLQLLPLFFFTSGLISLFSENRETRLLLVLLFLVLLSEHFYTLRPDSIKLSFFAGFLYFILRSAKGKREWLSGIAAALFATSALFFKQDSLVYCGIVYIVVLYFYRRASVRISLLLFVALSSGLWIYFSHEYGTALYRNLFPYNFQYSGAIWVNLMFIGYNVFRTFPLVLFSLWNACAADKDRRALAILSVLFYVVSNLLLFRTGSNLNYTTESVLLLLINLAVMEYDTSILYSIRTLAFCLLLIVLNHFLVYRQYITPVSWNKEKKEFVIMKQEAKEIKAVTGKELVFFTNPKYVIFNPQLNLVYGYDIHFERFSELYLPVKLKPEFISMDYSNYDEWFSKGKVKYIVSEDKQVAVEQMKRCYPRYSLFRKIGNMQVYAAR